jgi:hypothetical protein
MDSLLRQSLRNAGFPVATSPHHLNSGNFNLTLNMQSGYQPVSSDSAEDSKVLFQQASSLITEL